MIMSCQLSVILSVRFFSRFRMLTWYSLLILSTPYFTTINKLIKLKLHSCGMHLLPAIT